MRIRESGPCDVKEVLQFWFEEWISNDSVSNHSPRGFRKCSLFSGIIDEWSMVERPNHTQLWAFVVDSRCCLRRDSRKIGKWPLLALPATVGPRLVADGIVRTPSVRSLGSTFIILCLEAYTKHETTNTTIAKQNVDSSTYIPISSAECDCDG